MNGAGLNGDDHLAYMLARGQFGFTISCHIVLAAFSIGLSNYLMFLEAMWLWTRRRACIDTFNYWLKILAINFAVGAVTGIVMEYQMGMNWGGLSARAGAVIGPLMLYEVIIAFFLEAGFLGVMLFGMKKVGEKWHFFATTMVASGSVFSAFWILSAISWMQTPAGTVLAADGTFVPTDWLTIIFNPSFPWRLLHMTSAAFVATGLFIAGTAAWHLSRARGNDSVRLMFSSALWMLTVAAPFQFFTGDQHGENTLAHQPQKLAAMEGDWITPPPGAGEPMVLFAIPDMAEQRNHATIAIPRVASLYLRHNLTGTIHGLRDFPPSDIPYVPLVFYSFRIMVGLGMLIWAAAWLHLVPRWRGRLYESRWLRRSMMALTPAGFVAMIAGWVVTEAGRQPYTVFGVLRTEESRSPIPLSGMVTSFSVIVLLYLIVYGVGAFYVAKLLSAPPEPGETGPHPDLVDRMGGGPPLFAGSKEVV
jgi:cytochrome d ubiquinol oxidase subunit I